MEKMSRQHVPTSFGVFKPTGHVVMVFADQTAADAAEHDLQVGGYEPDEITRFTPQDWQETMQLAHANTGLLATMGAELDLIEIQDKLARRGHHFMVVWAPSDDETRHVATIARRHGAVLAQKYGRLVIQNLVLHTDASVAADKLFGVRANPG